METEWQRRNRSVGPEESRAMMLRLTSEKHANNSLSREPCGRDAGVLSLASSFVQWLLGISNTHWLQEMGEIFTLHSQWCQIKQYHNNLKALNTAIRLVLQSGSYVLIAFDLNLKKQKAIEPVNSTHFCESVQLSPIQWFVCGTTMLKNMVNMFYLWLMVDISVHINYNLI